jgi:hypothetical protein
MRNRLTSAQYWEMRVFLTDLVDVNGVIQLTQEDILEAGQNHIITLWENATFTSYNLTNIINDAKWTFPKKHKRMSLSELEDCVLEQNRVIREILDRQAVVLNDLRTAAAFPKSRANG